MKYQVEYMSRPDELEHIVPYDSFVAASAFAKEMSDKHDGCSVVVALRKRGGRYQACGHVEFVFGMEQVRVGRITAK